MKEIQGKSILVRVSEGSSYRDSTVKLLVIVQTVLVVTTAGSLLEWRQGSFNLLRDFFKNHSKEPP